jgi:hypothetical protein
MDVAPVVFSAIVLCLVHAQQAGLTRVDPAVGQR